MSSKIAQKITQTVRLLFLFFVVLLAISYALAVTLSAVAFYRSSQGASYRDVEELVKPVGDLEEIWGDKGELSALQATLEKKNQELQAAAADLGTMDSQVVLSRLQTISANLSYLGEVLRNRRSKAAEAVKELETKVTALQRKLGPPDAPEKVVESLFREAGGIFIALLWPLVFLAVFFYLLKSRQAPERLRELLGGFKSFKLGLAEIVLDDSGKTKARTEDAFAALREQARLQYDLWVQRKSIREKLEEVVEEVTKYLANNSMPLPEYRCTLHVPDIVFADTLYQLLDYLPTGSGRGRVFSVRFGIIGKVWRLFSAETQGAVPLDETRLAQEWGMTKEEAKHAARNRPSFLCVPLKDATEGHVGMFYMDSKSTAAFNVTNKPDKDLHDLIVTTCQQNGLIGALAKMKEELSGKAPLIRVYEK